MNSFEYLYKQLDDNISRLEKESTKHKLMFRKYKYSIYVLTAISGILAALIAASDQFIPMVDHKIDIHLIISICIVIIAAIVGFINSLDGLRKPQQLWIQERQLYYGLKDLQRELRFDYKVTEDKASKNNETEGKKTEDEEVESGEKPGETAEVKSKTNKPKEDGDKKGNDVKKEEERAEVIGKKITRKDIEFDCQPYFDRMQALLSSAGDKWGRTASKKK